MTRFKPVQTVLELGYGRNARAAEGVLRELGQGREAIGKPGRRIRRG
jgi:hypothetical protein